MWRKMRDRRIEPPSEGFRRPGELEARIDELEKLLQTIAPEKLKEFEFTSDGWNYTIHPKPR